jgi:glucose-1-phosphate thymidylyltransferase
MDLGIAVKRREPRRPPPPVTRAVPILHHDMRHGRRSRSEEASDLLVVLAESRSVEHCFDDQGQVCRLMAAARGLICAGGEATRLGELTRVANKHLLPIGRWPLIYYPLQLLQLAGIREVLIVTGKAHAGQMIDLLGDGKLSARGTNTPLLDLDLTYKVQMEPVGIAQVVGMARDFAAGGKLVVVLGDNVFENAHDVSIREWAERSPGARIFVKEVPDPENFGVVVYGDDGRVTDIVEKAGVVDLRYAVPPTNDAVVGLYLYPPDVFDVIDELEPSNRGELEITDVNRHYALAGRLEVERVKGWWEDAGKHWQHLAEIGRRIEETAANRLDA